MRRLFTLLLLLATLAITALWFGENPGQVTFVWLGYEVAAPIWLFAGAMCVATLALHGLLRLVGALWTSPRALRRLLAERREARGMDALTKGFAALGLGQLEEARQWAKQAEGLLGEPPISLLLSAQVAGQRGETMHTRSYWERLLSHDSTRLIATRGLVQQSVGQQDYAAAVNYAMEAVRLSPKDRWTALAVVDLFARQQRWAEVEAHIERARARRALSDEESRHLLAATYYELAQGLLEDGREDLAIRRLAKANKTSPQFIPATTKLAALYASQQRFAPAWRAICRSWKKQPHPELTEALLRLLENGRPEKLLKRFDSLARLQPAHPESMLATAIAAMHVGEWQRARDALTKATQQRETVRSCELMAALERGEHRDEHAANQWLGRAHRAQADEAWNCGECGHTQEAWSLYCEACSSFASISWRQPPDGRRAAALPESRYRMASIAATNS